MTYGTLHHYRLSGRPHITFDETGNVADLSLDAEGGRTVILTIPAKMLAQWPEDIERELARKPQPNPDR
ncbi:MAG: hypothetical protein HOH66_06265 [Rhodospirillaceae bacterium]|jgi:hypothetical protein|nr:hypothetical protein [Rhodospirillaceae bacterium]MBT6117454.1 hypothetical protein [Rhodospirillaceae bacterium]